MQHCLRANRRPELIVRNVYQTCLPAIKSTGLSPRRRVLPGLTTLHLPENVAQGFGVRHTLAPRLPAQQLLPRLLCHRLSPKRNAQHLVEVIPILHRYLADAMAALPDSITDEYMSPSFSICLLRRHWTTEERIVPATLPPQSPGSITLPIQGRSERSQGTIWRQGPRTCSAQWIPPRMRNAQTSRARRAALQLLAAWHEMMLVESSRTN